ncbi:MAG: hypothetical protein CL489_17780 [Acidobacteria bacterium]|nr:hypothetical protein [Acidobacteriota bacterium]
MSEEIRAKYLDILNNRFDYKLQAYVLDGIVQDCGHQDDDECNCEARRYANRSLDSVYEEKGWNLKEHQDTQITLQIIADKAFDKALADGRLSKNPSASNYEGNYMFMGNDKGKDTFKHVQSRKYDV